MSQTFIFKRFWTFLGSPWEHPRRAHQKMVYRKWTPKSTQDDRTKCLFLQRILKILSFCDRIRCASLFANRFQNKQKIMCFIDVSDSFTGPMLHHLKGHAKVKNERHAAWERSGAKRDERHAAWERFLLFHGPERSRQGLPPKRPKPLVFKRFLDQSGFFIKM